MTFTEFLEAKKIDAKKFRQKRPADWNRFSDQFNEMSPVSFDHYVKFLINEWRLEFPGFDPKQQVKPAPTRTTGSSTRTSIRELPVSPAPEKSGEQPVRKAPAFMKKKAKPVQPELPFPETENDKKTDEQD